MVSKERKDALRNRRKDRISSKKGKKQQLEEKNGIKGETNTVLEERTNTIQNRRKDRISNKRMKMIYQGRKMWYRTKERIRYNSKLFNRNNRILFSLGTENCVIERT